MIKEASLFTDKDRMFLDRERIDCFTVPLGDKYDDDIFNRYFAIYAGLGRKYKPARIFEVGVRYGATGICMILGAAEAVESLIYRGIDDASYGDPDSCVKANRNFAEQVPFANARCLHHNSFHGAPEEVQRLAPYDLIHIDGNHDQHGVRNDFGVCWPLLADQGIIVLDDATHPPIRAAIDEFLAAMAGVTDVLVRHQTYESARGHVFLQKVAR